MRKSLMSVFLGVSLLLGCARQPMTDLPVGTDVNVHKRDGVTVEGRLVALTADELIVERKGGARETIKRSEIQAMSQLKVSPEREGKVPNTEPAPRAAVDSSSSAGNTTRPGERGLAIREMREVVVPAGTELDLTLETAVASDTSQPEDPVRARLRNAVRVDGATAIPAESTVLGTVADVRRAAKVKGRARLSLRFHTLKLASGTEAYEINASAVVRRGRGTKKDDAFKIGAPAAGGAIIGGIIGGKKGAVIGGAAGGGAGTAVVLSTRGEEARLARGTPLSLKLLQPLTVRVPVKS